MFQDLTQSRKAVIIARKMIFVGHLPYHPIT